MPHRHHTLQNRIPPWHGARRKRPEIQQILGNGIDPLVLANTYGADAIRMALVLGAVPGNDVSFDEQRVKGYRNFSTKIWNIGRFIKMNQTEMKPGLWQHKDRQTKYFEEFNVLQAEITTHIENFEFHLAGEKIYHYVWHRLADEIIEAERETLKSGTDEEKATSSAALEDLFLSSLKLLHPFMPFVTEAVWQKFRPGAVLMVEKW